MRVEGGNRQLRWGSYGADLGLYELADMHERDVVGYLTEKAVVEYLERALKI